MSTARTGSMVTTERMQTTAHTSRTRRRLPRRPRRLNHVRQTPASLPAPLPALPLFPKPQPPRTIRSPRLMMTLAPPSPRPITSQTTLLPLTPPLPLPPPRTSPPSTTQSGHTTRHPLPHCSRPMMMATPTQPFTSRSQSQRSLSHYQPVRRHMT